MDLYSRRGLWLIDLGVHGSHLLLPFQTLSETYVETEKYKNPSGYILKLFSYGVYWIPIMIEVFSSKVYRSYFLMLISHESASFSWFVPSQFYLGFLRDTLSLNSIVDAVQFWVFFAAILIVLSVFIRNLSRLKRYSPLTHPNLFSFVNSHFSSLLYLSFYF